MTYAVQLRCSLTHAHSRAPVISLMCTRMKTWSVPNAAFCYCKESNEKMLSNDRSQLNLDGWFPLSSKSFLSKLLALFLSEHSACWLIILCIFAASFSDELATRAWLLSSLWYLPLLCSAQSLQPPGMDSAASFCLEPSPCLEWLSQSRHECQLLSKDFSKLSQTGTFCLFLYSVVCSALQTVPCTK